MTENERLRFVPLDVGDSNDRTIILWDNIRKSRHVRGDLLKIET